jgi:hypothetical protein
LTPPLALELSEEDWAEEFALMFFGPVRCSRTDWHPICPATGKVQLLIWMGDKPELYKERQNFSVNLTSRRLRF